jgi:hypothetical protein
MQPAEKGTAFRRSGRSDLDRIFSIQTERVVSKHNTVAIKDRWWHTLAGKLSPSMNTWINPCRFDTVHTSSDAIPQAVEKMGPWKLRKTSPRLPATPTAPWKSPPAIPTLPPLRRRFSQSPKSKAKRAA